MIIQNQFPLGKPSQLTQIRVGYSRLTYIIIFSAILIGGSFYYWHITNMKYEKKSD